ncbi:helix-turn-helix transcriptional regulator [Bacillus mobilis]|uniref:helix-turn-helix transcriptional regulator n=1 Tax=Bacillus mobilis TaxID=2026190 RepID=UPI0035DEA354
MENVLQVLRREKKLSQDELAKLCHVSRQTINAIENNKYNLTLELPFSLAKNFGVTVDQLFIYKS